MTDLLKTYFDDAYTFLPKTFVSSSMSQSVRDKVFEKMIKTLSFSPSLCGSEKLTLRILSTEPFSLGLLPEVVEKLGLEYTYYKWVKVGDDFELTLYKDKPKEEYTQYLLQVFTFILGYVLICPLAFIFSCGVFTVCLISYERIYQSQITLCYLGLVLFSIFSYRFFCPL